jgi:RNA polymerase sigma factor (sigma-70 family)
MSCQIPLTDTVSELSQPFGRDYSRPTKKISGRPMDESHRERFARQFIEHSVALRRKMRRLISSRADVDDLIQEAFLRGYENADKVRIPAAFVYSAARNFAFDGHRRDRKAKKVGLGEIALSGVEFSVESVELQLLAEERARLLRDAVEHLAPQCRTVFALKVFQGYSYKEIAEELGISVKTVENHLARGLRQAHQFVRRRYGASGGNG